MRLDQSHTLLIKRCHSVSHDVQRFEQRISDVRHHHVQLQLTRVGAVCDCRVMAQHVKADHVEHLRNRGIHLARHNARARLKCRQLDLVEACVWPGIQQTQIVCDLRQLDRKTRQTSRHRHEVAETLLQCYTLLRLYERQTGELTKVLNRELRVFRRGVCVCNNTTTTERHFQ